MNICKHCGKEFPISFNGRRVFCSDNCFNTYYKRFPKKNKTCAICGGALDGRQRKYCDKCKKIANNNRANEYNKDQYKKPQAEATPKKRARPKKFLSLAELERLARAEGLTAGQYCVKHRLYEK